MEETLKISRDDTFKDNLSSHENMYSRGVNCVDVDSTKDVAWFSVLAHRDYAHRIHDWITSYPNPYGLYHGETYGEISKSQECEAHSSRRLAHPIHDVDHYYHCSVLKGEHSKDNNKPEETIVYIASAIPKRRQGKRQSCELYVVLVTYTSMQVLKSMPAMGRRAIRRIDRLIVDKGKPQIFKNTQESSSKLLEKLQKHGKSHSTIQLRTDIFPKTKQTTWMSEIWMDHLLNNRSLTDTTNLNGTAFIEGCPSASKADFVSILIRLDDGEQKDNGLFLSGITPGKEFLFSSRMLNEHATSQLPVALEENSQHRSDGNVSRHTDLENSDDNGDDLSSLLEEVSSESLSARKNASQALPQSRAFYKMKEILEVILCPPSFSSFFGKGWLETVQSFSFHEESCSGLDLGASPGGWTQALRGGGGPCVPACGEVVPRVISVDAGALSRLVLNLGNVSHIKALFPSQAVIRAMANAAPFSFICCDSNRDYVKTMEDLRGLFTGARQFLQQNPEQTFSVDANCASTTSKRRRTKQAESKDDANDLSEPPLLASTCIFVLTIKFCHKRTKAIQSVLDEQISPNIRSDLKAIAGFDVPFQMFHLMANSVSERTIVANIGRGT